MRGFLVLPTPYKNHSKQKEAAMHAPQKKMPVIEKNGADRLRPTKGPHPEPGGSPLPDANVSEDGRCIMPTDAEGARTNAGEPCNDGGSTQ